MATYHTAGIEPATLCPMWQVFYHLNYVWMCMRLTSDYHTAISHLMRTITLLTDPAHAAVFHAHCRSLWGTAAPTSAGSEPATGLGEGI